MTLPTPQQLREKRLRNRFSLRQVAEAMKISAPYLYDLEKGHRPWNAQLRNRHRIALGKVKFPPRPHFVKVATFKKVFPHALENNEWKVKWPIQHKHGKTYNPDFFSPALGCYIEVVTSWTGYAADRMKWQAALLNGYPLRVYWWNGADITAEVYRGAFGSEVRHIHDLARD